jgi:hypothetical protein
MTFDEYWPEYLRHHAHPINRGLHACGWTLLLASFGAGVALRRPLLPVLGVVGAYGCAWIGHFCFEGETPQTFRHPVLANLASLHLFTLMAVEAIAPRATSRWYAGR